MIPIKILICDDEKAYIDDIKNHLKLFLAENCIQWNIRETTNGAEMLENPEFFDIAFLDIEIDGISGIEIGHALKAINEHIVIFIVTAYDKYLDDAMDLNVFRFFGKPINPQRFYSGLEKAITNIDNSEIEFPISYNGGFAKVPVKDIMYVEIVGRKTKVTTKDKTYYSTSNMNFWKEVLIPTFFFQIHNSFIINLNFVRSFDNDFIKTKNGCIVPVSQRKKSEFKKYFLEYFSR